MAEEQGHTGGSQSGAPTLARRVRSVPPGSSLVGSCGGRAIPGLAALRRALADLCHAVVDDLTAAFNQILGLGTTEAFLQAQARAIRAAVREGEAFDQYVRERGSRPLAPQIANALGVAGRSALVVGDHLPWAGRRARYRAQLQTPADREVPLLGQVHTLTAAYAQLGNQLDQASNRAASGAAGG